MRFSNFSGNGEVGDFAAFGAGELVVVEFVEFRVVDDLVGAVWAAA